MRRHTFFFVRKRGYTLHIDAPDGGTKMETEKVYAMPFAKIYPILVAKAGGKGRTQAEVDEIIYDEEDDAKVIDFPQSTEITKKAR